MKRLCSDLQLLALSKAAGSKPPKDCIKSGETKPVDFYVHIMGTISKGEPYPQKVPVLKVGALERMVLILLNKVNATTAAAVTQDMIQALVAESMNLDEEKISEQMANVKEYAETAFKALTENMNTTVECQGKTTGKVTAFVVPPEAVDMQRVMEMAAN